MQVSLLQLHRCIFFIVCAQFAACFSLLICFLFSLLRFFDSVQSKSKVRNCAKALHLRPSVSAMCSRFSLLACVFMFMSAEQGQISLSSPAAVVCAVLLAIRARSCRRCCEQAVFSRRVPTSNAWIAKSHAHELPFVLICFQSKSRSRRRRKKMWLKKPSVVRMKVPSNGSSRLFPRRQQTTRRRYRASTRWQNSPLTIVYSRCQSRSISPQRCLSQAIISKRDGASIPIGGFEMLS